MICDLLATVPFYKIINVSLSSVILLISLLFLALSYRKCRFKVREFSHLRLPSTPNESYAPGLSSTVFPHGCDFLITALLLTGLFYIGIDLSSDADATSGDEGDMSLAILLFNLVISIAIYLPCIIRWLMLPSAKRAEVSVWAVLSWILGSFLIVGTAAAFFEQIGFNDWITQTTQSPALQEIVTSLQQGSVQQQIFIAISAIIIAPIGEELLFRGFLYPSIKPMLGKYGAILLSSLLFGVFHMALLQTPMLTILGVILCLAYERARSLWLPIVLHMIFNSVSVIANIFFADFIQ